LWAVVGLGNPGKRYSRTRHNAGFLFLKRVAKEWQVRLKKRMYSSKTNIVENKHGKILLAVPQTYMNNSGLAVMQILEGRKVMPGQLVIVYDDLDIPLGEIRVRKEGGAGTHKGMNSIIHEINTTQFPRIRIGIGPLTPNVNATDFVLSSFDGGEMVKLEEGMMKAKDALDLILSGKIEKAMNLFNIKINSNYVTCR